jgi:hypothetical protein
MKRILLSFTVLLIVWVVPLSNLRAGSVQDTNTKMTLTGCLIGGEGDDGYLLTNMTANPRERASSGAVAPGPVGTAGTAATTLYWLEDDDELEPHVGHRVEVQGELTGDVEEGEIEIEREDSWTELRIQSDGRDLTVRVPHSVVVMPPRSDSEQKVDVLVRKVDVDRVRMLAASCD